MRTVGGHASSGARLPTKAGWRGYSSGSNRSSGPANGWMSCQGIGACASSFAAHERREFACAPSRPRSWVVGASLRLAIELLAEQWLGARHIEPMGFLVALEPFHHPAMHRYFVAERRGVVTGFLSGRSHRGATCMWLVEDVAREARTLPNRNETQESLVLSA